MRIYAPARDTSLYSYPIVTHAHAHQPILTHAHAHQPISFPTAVPAAATTSFTAHAET